MGRTAGVTVARTRSRMRSGTGWPAEVGKRPVYGILGSEMVPFLAIAFVVLPIVELAVLIAVGREIGVWWTILLVILVSVAGAWLARREGTAAWRRFQRALTEGRMPTSEVADGAMVLFAAALLLTPGFVSDVLAIALLIPPIRAVARSAIVRYFVARSLRRAGFGGLGGTDDGARRGRRGPRVIDGQVRGDGSGDGSGDGERPSTRIAWGEPELDRERVDGDEPPTSRRRP